MARKIMIYFLYALASMYPMGFTLWAIRFIYPSCLYLFPIGFTVWLITFSILVVFVKVKSEALTISSSSSLKENI